MGTAYQIQDQSLAHYFTFQVVGWADIFSRKIYRNFILDSFKYCQKEKGMELFSYEIMTNHIHVIVRSKENKLSDLIRDFKNFTSKGILKEVLSNGRESRREWLEMIFKYHAKFNKRSSEMQFWTHDNHAIGLDTNQLMDSRLNYIHMNPVQSGSVSEPEDYFYSSARDYSGQKGVDLEAKLKTLPHISPATA